MPKKGGSSRKAVDLDSDEDIIDPIKAAANAASDKDDPIATLPAAPSKHKKAKKKKGKKRDDSDDEDEVEKKIRELALSDSGEDVPRPVKSKKSKAKAAAVSAFALLDDGSDDNDNKMADESDGVVDVEIEVESREPKLNKKSKKSKANKNTTADAVEGDVEVNGADELSSMIAALPADSGDESKPSKKDKKKKKKKGKQAVADGEDLDAILAELDEGKKPEETKELDAPSAEVKQAEDGGAEESAAAKKRRKKQKQKERKELEEAGVVVEPAASAETADQVIEEDTEEKKTSKKKKDKKKKAADAEPSVTEEKKPKNKKIAAMKEALAKAKEDQERMDREEEERIQRAEEAKRQKEEEKRLKEEQKRKQKEKEKEKKERKKAEGKLLTPAQKAERERALQMLAARGIAMPSPGDKPKKKPLYGKPRKNKKEEESKSETVKEDGPEATATVEKEVVQQEVKEEVKEAWDDASDDDKAWDADTEEEDNVENSVEKANPAEEMHELVEEEEDEEESSEEPSSEEGSDDSSEEDSSSDDDDMTPKERAEARITKRQQLAEANKSPDRLRAPVVCVLGHVDTGKTKILDKLRRTNVQDGEAGGITQQIGATNVPLDAIEKQTSFVKDFKLEDLKVPGLLIIDTPGHESFSNLRTRGSSLCDIAILVIDIMHGLEPQTIESIQLLKKGKTPFVVALNKIDRMYGWKASPYQDVQAVIKKQTPNTKSEFDERTAMVITQLAEQSLNAALYYENPNPKEYISLIPTSAHSGDGMGNLIALLCQYSQTFLAKRVAVTDNLQCTVMEVKALPGLGTTVDVILVNGKLRNGDVVVMPGTEGPIVTHIRELLMPEPMKELRVKSQYRHHKEVEAAQGVKIVGKDLDKVLAGLPMYVAKYQDEVEVYKLNTMRANAAKPFTSPMEEEWIGAALKNVLNAIKLSPTGVFVQASTLGSMEALLEYLRSVKVPYAGINIGPVHKKDVMKASAMLEHGEAEYATILAFDVKVERDATELADNLGVKIFTAEIIYHLFDAFTKYQEELLEKGQRENNHLKVFPCKLRVLPQFIFNSRDPIIMGVSVEAGFLSTGTPICVPSKEFTHLGIVTSVEKENKPVDRATKGMEVCIKIENIPGQAPRLYGRHFDENDMLVSKISRESINAIKKYWKKDMSKDDWRLIIELKKTFEIL